VPVGAGEEDKGACGAGVAVDLGLGVERVAGDDDRGQVRGASALACDASCARAGEAEEACQGARRVLFNHREGWRYLVDVHLCCVSALVFLGPFPPFSYICVQGRKQQLGCNTDLIF
jgi:hypothetical protein